MAAGAMTAGTAPPPAPPAASCCCRCAGPAAPAAEVRSAHLGAGSARSKLEPPCGLAAGAAAPGAAADLRRPLSGGRLATAAVSVTARSPSGLSCGSSATASTPSLCRCALLVPLHASVVCVGFCRCAAVTSSGACAGPRWSAALTLPASVATHGCRRTSVNAMRALGLRRRRPSTSSAGSRDIEPGGSTTLAAQMRSTASFCEPAKGGRPTIISKRSTPNAHKSTAVSCGSLSNISGAR
mmetsp:Transcript_123467/g.348923  ORF Transcript_123467/g.348923 Transcript_123467/m.348923 type:complete len:240 (+) Transcript_123467:678-1397(+)